MHANTPKQNRRFSPLASRTSNKPRVASQASRTATARLYAARINDFEPPLSGHGALNSQLGETQYFAQFGVDVQLPEAHLYSPSPSPSPPSSPSFHLPSTPPDDPTPPLDSSLKSHSWRMRGIMRGNGNPTHIDLSPYGLDDPLKDAFIEETEEESDVNWPYWVDKHGNSHNFSQEESVEAKDEDLKVKDEDVKVKTEDVVDDTTIGLYMDVASTTHEVEEVTELDEFETWLVFRVRAAHAKGESAVTELRRLYKGLGVLREKVVALKAENAELKGQLGQIKAVISSTS
ncbi:hypothetical protein R3P38DRAFT_3186525 [Favolaschia claudopus]|uniref:Uncharacterized protein n=1 Tax=Favolaschia claudopus TaxID=2862362 RepID=A0AAW0C2S7_9AGAR